MPCAAPPIPALPWRTQGHALLPLGDAYRGKLAALQAAVNGQLLAKREALLQQHARLAARAGEVAAARAGLERDVAVSAACGVRPWLHWRREDMRHVARQAGAYRYTMHLHVSSQTIVTHALARQPVPICARKPVCCAHTRTLPACLLQALAEDMLGKVRSAESLKQALLGREQAEVRRAQR